MLTASKILDEIKNNNIEISPFNIDQLNPNSYNIKLAPILKIYSKTKDHVVLDPLNKKSLTTESFKIPENGIILHPGILYLGSTEEIIWSDKYISAIDGRSSIGRLGITIHVTAGFGDLGFRGTYTLEISVIHPVIVYPGMAIGQVYFTEPLGDIDFLYNGRYQYQTEPIESRFNMNDNELTDYHYKID